MVYENFRFNCTWRVILLGISIYAFFYLVFYTSWYAVPTLMALLTIFQLYDLFSYIDNSNRDLTLFLYSIKNSDFSHTFKGAGLGSSYRELKIAFNEVLAEFQKTRAEKEEHYHYLQNVFKHVGIGLISFRANGDVEMLNTSARQLLEVPRLRHIKGLDAVYPSLADKLRRLKPGERSLFKFESDDDQRQLAMFATEFTVRDETIKLVSLQNIQSELEEKEMEAWQNLIRVLTHEIMNSITPISSLAATATGLVSSLDQFDHEYRLDHDTMDDIIQALGTIESRSKGLLHFVESYRNLTRIPKPVFKMVPVSAIVNQVHQLMQHKLAEAAVECSVSITPQDLTVTADPELISQILINLVLNAVQALETQSEQRIDIIAHEDEHRRVVIKVQDNGPGILPEVIDNIFIPFFTTRRHGSGIGLSLSRQIMRLHGGTISVHSEPNVLTVFTLRF